jgi:hypothetical protein
LPDAADGNQITNFDWWIPNVDRMKAFSLLGKIVVNFIARPEAIVMIQDDWHETSQPLWRDYEHKELARFYRKEIYWRLAGTDLTPELAAYVVEGASFWPFAAFPCFPAAFSDDDHLTDADIEELATKTVASAVDAFDADSFVMLWREDILPFPWVA